MKLNGMHAMLERLVCSLQNIIGSLPGMAQPVPPADDPKPATSDDCADDKPMEHRASGIITAFILYIGMVFIALRMDSYGELWHAIIGTFFGDMTEARLIDHSLLGLLGALSATVTVAVPLAIGNLLYGQVKSHTVAKMFSGIKNHYLLMTATVTAEELLARLFFLGLPLKLANQHLSLPLFWALFLVGNIIWALVHLANFDNPEERKVIRTLPQFVGGVFFTVIFINFGFFGALMVHLAYNNLLFSTMRKGIFNLGEYLVIAWHSLVVLVSGYFLFFKGGKSLWDMTFWLDSSATSYLIPGWNTPNYLWGVLMATSLLVIFGDISQFDLYCADYQKHVYDNLLKALAILVFAFGAFFGLRTLNVPFEMRVAVMAVIFMVIVRSASGSGMARAFWIGIPSLMIQLCTVLALGWKTGGLIVLAVALVEAVDDVIRIKDRHWEEAAEALRRNAGAIVATLLPSRSR